MFIKTSNAALGSFTFLVLTAIFIILHNLIASFTQREEPFFFSLVFISALAFLIFITIFIAKIVVKIKNNRFLKKIERF